MRKSLKYAALLLAFEVVRECVVLRSMGFQPDKFIAWMRDGEL